MIGHVAEVGALGADHAAEHGDEGVQMPFAMAGGPRLKEVQEALLYGTMAAVRVTHGAPPDCKVISMEEHTRVATYRCFSSYFLYGSQDFS
jgi:hypothetical protein